MQEEFHKDEQILPVGYLLAGRYVLDAFLGSGGMGAVYKAHDRLLEDKMVAIKILHKEFSRDSELTRRFLREVNMMHSVNNPNVVRTYDAGVQDGLFFFTMEYVEGLLLDRYLETLGRDYTLLGRITAQICKGLEAIHSQNIVHRDLKPGNILVSNDGMVKITDFGVARPVSSGHTAHREIMGSLDYIPPEVFQGNQISPASDFYSLGVILYGIVCGVFPFDAEDPMAIVWKHVNEIPITPSSRNPEVPPWMDKLIMRLLEKDPARRPQNARQVIRFVRENIFKDGKVLDSGAHEINPSDNINAKKYDTDIFELDFDPEDLTENAFEENSPLISLHPDSFTSACNQVIFDALPTVDNIRQHEELWEERKKKRADGHDLKGLAAKIKQAEKNDEMRKIRIAIQVFGFITVFSLLVVFTMKFSDPEREGNGSFEKNSMSINDLRKDYLSGKVDLRNSNNRKVEKKNNSTNWSLSSLIPETFNEEKLQSLSFNRLNAVKTNVSYLSSDSPAAEEGRELPTVDSGSYSRPIQSIQQQISVSNAEMQRQALTQPAISTEYRPSSINTNNIARDINEPTEAQRKALVEKKKIRENLALVNGQIDAYNVQGEEVLINKEKEAAEQISKIESFQQSVNTNIQNQFEKQKALSFLISELDKGEVIKVAKELTKIDAGVSERLTQYQKSEEAYKEMMDSVKDGKLAFDKIALNEVSDELKRQRLELDKTIKKGLNDNIVDGFKELLEASVIADVTKEKIRTIALEKESRRSLWQQIQSGGAEPREDLESKKLELQKKLAEQEASLPESQESPIRGLVTMESFGEVK